MKSKTVAALNCGVELRDDDRGIMFVGADASGRDFGFPLFAEEIDDLIGYLNDYKSSYGLDKVIFTKDYAPSLDKVAEVVKNVKPVRNLPEKPLPNRDEMGARSAVSNTPPEKIGNPFLAESAPSRNSTGQQIYGADAVDLGAMKQAMDIGLVSR